MKDARVVIGLGLSSTATPDEVSAALATAVHAARCGWPDVVEIATIDSRRGHPALASLDVQLGGFGDGGRRVPVRFYSAAELASVRSPHPSAAIQQATGTASVAEAAALVSSGAHELLVPKRCTQRVCTAVARIELQA